ncbi:Dynein regulatory complex protein 8, partial [Kappamyces sp. JEL0680]
MPPMLTAQMEEDEPSGYVTWSKFQLVASQIMNGKYPVKDDEEVLFRAFQVLDEEKKGYLLPEDIRKFLTTMGEPFTQEEIEEMLAACTDPTENKVYYEDYVQVLGKT